MRFEDRADAARQLAGKLQAYRGQHPLILAIPRGAVAMAHHLAEALGGDLDVVLVRKLCAPGDPEFALGAMDETGWVYLADETRFMANPGHIASEKAAQLALMQERRARYTPDHLPQNPSGRVVIVVDDGLATGATMIAALHAIRAKNPAKLVCAVPVASAEALHKVQKLADEVVCLHVPARFYAVGQFYDEFRQVGDDEVVDLLNHAATQGRHHG